MGPIKVPKIPIWIIAGLTFLPFLFVTVGELRQLGQGKEKEYTVPAGKHDFKPNALPWPHFGAREYEFSIRFDSSAWWSIEDEDYPYGNDIEDWNKAGGLTNYLNANNKQSVLIGWRPSPDYMVMEITGYVNDRDGKFRTGPPRRVPVGQYTAGKINQFGSVAYFNYGDTIVALAASKAFITREIDMWFGGNREAHKQMKAWKASKIK